MTRCAGRPPDRRRQGRFGSCIEDRNRNRDGMRSAIPVFEDDEPGKAILAGDVDFDAVLDKAAAITPVPGGVGPMTITMLMKNTVQSAKQAAGLI